MRPLAITFCLFYGVFVDAQEDRLKAFENLAGSTWKIEGEFENGSTFRQTRSYEYRLGGKMVQVLTKGLISPYGKPEEYGDRNVGVRTWNKETGKLEFYEFDVFGGITRGDLIIEGMNISYRYEYNGEIFMDALSFINEDTYDFTIGTRKDGQWDQVFLKTTMVRVP